jgi:hypothetical protein
MKYSPSIQRCEVRLPVAVCAPGKAQTQGMTEFISPRVIRFSLDRPAGVARGDAVMLFVCLPSEITAGNQVLIRARVRVMGVERHSKTDGGRFTFTATMESYDFIAKALGI